MSRICLCLTGKTIEQDLNALELYRDKVDLVELRADFLETSEQLKIRTFPEKAGLPTILTIRRKSDGGMFSQGEGMRLVIFARGLSYSDTDQRKNFAYLDIEHDFHIPSIEDAAKTFGTKIIRSKHLLKGIPDNIEEIWANLSAKPDEIPKLAVQATNLADVERIFKLFENKKGERIVVSMGEYGFCTRLLAEKLGSILVYTSTHSEGLEIPTPGQLSPENLLNLYRAREYKSDWRLYGIVGAPSIMHSLSPIIHNKGFIATKQNALLIPFPADSVDSFLMLADRLNLKAFAVTSPFKEQILDYLSHKSMEVNSIGACNTVIRDEDSLIGYNTDAYGFSVDVRRFLKTDLLEGIKTTIIGAGGVARAVAFVLHNLGADVCIINRNMSKAKHLAEKYNFEWAGMTEKASELLERHNDLIIQATTTGMLNNEDPIDWYQFTGKEALFETIYTPQETKLMKRAKEAGCRVTNGMAMLKTQAEAQFALFTGMNYPKGFSVSQLDN